MKMHRNAVEAAVSAAGDKLTEADKPLVELARSLADQVDATGLTGPGTRLAGTYLTCVRTLLARIGTLAPDVKQSRLAKMRAENDFVAARARRRKSS
jgi:outer membrane murein-binding lipoprotein Lpp